MATYIYILRLVSRLRNEQNWTLAENELIEKHFTYLKEKYEKNEAVLVGKTDYNISHKDNFGIVILKAATEKAAWDFMNNDPAIVGGIMTAELFPFRIALGDIN